MSNDDLGHQSRYSSFGHMNTKSKRYFVIKAQAQLNVIHACKTKLTLEDNTRYFGTNRIYIQRRLRGACDTEHSLFAYTK